MGGRFRFRVGFYLAMAYMWWSVPHDRSGTRWASVFAYDQTSWLQTVPLDEDWLRIVGIVSALISIRSNACTVLFASLMCHHVYVSILNAVNHNYLFALFSIYVAWYANSAASMQRTIHELMRGQVVMVYAYAFFWKLHPKWLDGTICKGIFLTFEEQKVSRGIPWAALHSWIPNVFQWVAMGGILLDGCLFGSFLLLRYGHRNQVVGTVLFHTFTALTMSERIGYSFPLVMMLTVFLFERRGDEARSASHVQSVRRIQWIGLVSLMIQWLLPLRGLVFGWEQFPYTMEGYRFSWTMMMHSKTSIMSPNTFLASIQSVGKIGFRIQ